MEQSTLDNDNPDEYFSDIIEMDLDGSCSSSTLSGPPPKKKKKTDISLLAEIAQERLEQQKDHHVRQEKMVQDLISTQTKFQNDLLEVFIIHYNNQELINLPRKFNDLVIGISCF
ncbi:GL25497 [Drosophila persimilis]|uniref:GL25497 n=1 Tax=Drosophila persimilis TaxID=7234 RepID=B4HBS5_DROPE|nr:GL25497 [Drosophila persimilis]